MIGAIGDEVGVDQPVGREAAHRKAAGQQPEIHRARGARQGAESHAERVAAGPRRRCRGRCAIGAGADIGRPFGQQQRHHRHHRGDREADRQRHAAPAPVLGEHRQERQKDQLTRGIGGGQEAHRQPVALVEPAVGDRRRHADRTRTRADPDQEPPGQKQLPRARHKIRQAGPEHQHQHAAQDRALEAGKFDEPGQKRPGRSHQHDVERHRPRDRRNAPAESVLQRQDHYTRGGAHPDTGKGRRKHHGEHDPRVMHPPTGEPCQASRYRWRGECCGHSAAELKPAGARSGKKSPVRRAWQPAARMARVAPAHPRRRAASRVSIASHTSRDRSVPSSRSISWIPVGEVTLISVIKSPITSIPTKISP